MPRTLSAPIPGESLTGAPRNYPWERPPEITDPEEAIQMHLSRLNDPDKLEAIMNGLEMGSIDIYNLTQGIMRSAVAQGIHTIDVGLLAAPVVHEYIKRSADKLGIEYDEGLENKEEKAKYERAMAAARAKKMLKNPPKEVPVAVEEPTKPKGLMSRRGK